MKVEDTLYMRRFPVTVETECRNIDKIYPLKQEIAARIYDLAGGFPIIRRIIVFGSSVTPKCGIDSDIDICIDADVSDGLKVYEMQKDVGEICGWNCDIIMYSDAGKTLRETLEREGVVIYEQSA